MHMSESARTTLKISSGEMAGRKAEGRRLVIRRCLEEQELVRKQELELHKMEQQGHRKQEQERHKKEQGLRKKEHHKKERALHKRQLGLRKS